MTKSLTPTDTYLLPEELWPDISHLVTEDEAPLDNLPSEKQQRLLTEPLYSSWSGSSDAEGFLVAANVGLFATNHQPPVVPDVFLSLDVQVAEKWWEKRHRSYFLWEFGKPPDVVIEIVSNKEGNETGRKLQDYARMRVTYYAIFDPTQQLQGAVLQVYKFQDGKYAAMTPQWLPQVELGLCLWEGVYEGKQDVWLRWCDRDCNVIPTGAERAEQERQLKEIALQQAEQERQAKEIALQQTEQERQAKEIALQQTEQERQAKEAAQQRAEQLAAQLRALDIDPDQFG